jgi:predicted acyl esterase
MMTLSGEFLFHRARACVVGALSLAVVLGVGRLPAQAACVGDCDASGTVTVDDLVAMVNVALGTAPVSGCTAGDQNGDGVITIDEIIAAAYNAQHGCPSAPTPTATPTATGSPTSTPIPTFAAHGSVEQIYVTDADPGTALQLIDSTGQTVQTGTADAQGSFIFRHVAVGRGYVVVMNPGNSQQVSQPVAATDPNDPPDPSLYSNQHLTAGYQYLTTRDGTKLNIMVYLPGPIDEGPYPTLVDYSGYDDANPEGPTTDPVGVIFGQAAGYAVVAINIRGTGCSGGAYDFFETLQCTDGYDAIETIAAQPWVLHHKVGMVGLSYPGYSQLFVAQYNPPSLAAIAPLSVISGVAPILYPGGIFNNGFALGWAQGRVHDSMVGGQPWSQTRLDNGDQVCIDNMKLRGQTPDLLAEIYANTVINPAIVDPLTPATFVNRINVPVFLAGAWQDEQVGPYFATMIGNFTGTDKLHFTIVNGSHGDALDPAIFTRWGEFLSFYVRGEIPQLTTGAQLALEGYAGFYLGARRVKIEPDRFTGAPSFAAALARFESEPKIRILFDGGGIAPFGSPQPGFERSFNHWPVDGLQPTIWYFQDGGRLDPALPAGNGADSYIYDPSRAQLSSCPNCNVWLAKPPWDWQPLPSGKAVAYVTDPLTDTLEMVGSGSVDLWLQSTATDTDLQVTLSEVRPDGNETYVQTGWLRASRRKLDDDASTILRPVQTGFAVDVAPLPAGQFVLARVEMYPFGHVFRAGSRIRISIEAPGGDRPSWQFAALPVPVDGSQVINTIAHSAAYPSRVVLPVVPDANVTTPLPPCPSLRGQPCRPYVAMTNTPG